MQNDHEQLSLGGRINEAVQKNRKLVFAVFGVIIVLLVAVVASLSLMDVMRKKAISGAEDLAARYETLRPTIGEAENADIETLLGDLDAFAKKHSGFSGARAWTIIGSICAAKDQWAEAEDAWLQAAKTAPKTYLAPLAFFDAATAAEKQGKNQEAVDLYTKSLSAPAAFPAASRAQFSIGRLLEGLNEKDAAIEAYRVVVAKWPQDGAGYAKLAQSRIIALEGGIGPSNSPGGNPN